MYCIYNTQPHWDKVQYNRLRPEVGIFIATSVLGHYWVSNDWVSNDWVSNDWVSNDWVSNDWVSNDWVSKVNHMCLYTGQGAMTVGLHAIHRSCEIRARVELSSRCASCDMMCGPFTFHS